MQWQKQIPQYLIFKKQKELLKNEINHDEVYSDTWKDKKIRMVRLC